MFLLPDDTNVIPQISSTDIRNWLKEVDDRIPFIQLQKNLDAEVLHYIIQNHLYMSK